MLQIPFTRWQDCFPTKIKEAWYLGHWQLCKKHRSNIEIIFYVLICQHRYSYISQNSFPHIPLSYKSWNKSCVQTLSCWVADNRGTELLVKSPKGTKMSTLLPSPPLLNIGNGVTNNVTQTVQIFKLNVIMNTKVKYCLFYLVSSHKTYNADMVLHQKYHFPVIMVTVWHWYGNRIDI